MSTGITAVVVAVVIVIGAVVFGVLAVLHRRRLRQRFGPEYERLASEPGGWREAEVELAGRERRVRGLDIQPLTDAARASYTGRWAGIQEQFIDAPAGAVAGAQILVAAVMAERGYPAGHHDQDQVLADLSVDHAAALDRYRAAEAISGKAGPASTEELRQTMAGYHARFADLLGEPADQGSGPTPAAAS